MPFYTSEQILNQAFDQGTGTLKTSGPSGAAAATAANQTTTNDRLGTPGTGEPAHAGGSTGLIGWARDILAKIAAFGTSAAPSADVVSVQHPNTYVSKSTLSILNAALTVDTLGAAQIAFYAPQTTPGGMGLIFEGTNSNATSPVWTSLRYLHEGSYAPYYSPPGGGNFMVAGNTYRVDCAGVTQIRVRVSAYTSGSWEVLAHRVYSPGLIPTVNEPSNTSSNQTYVLQVTTPSNCSQYYNDSVTPLGASATFTGSTRTMATGNNFFNALYMSDQLSIGSAAQIQGSQDAGVTWRPHLQASASPGIGLPMTSKRTVTSYRLVYTNGATLQTYFSATSSQTPN